MRRFFRDILLETRRGLAETPRALALVWRAAPRWTGLWIASLAFQGLLPVVVVYFTRPLVDGLDAIRSQPGWEWRPILLPAVAIGSALVLGEVLKQTIEWLRETQSDLVKDHVNGLVQEKSAEVDMAFHESSEYHDRLHQARNDAANKSLAVLESGGGLLQDGITFLAMAGVLAQYGVAVPILLAVSTLPAFFAVLATNRRYVRWWNDTTADRRWLHYYDAMLTESETAAEVRLYDLRDPFRQAYRGRRQRLRRERLELLGKSARARLTAALFGVLLSIAAVGWMALRASSSQASLGDLALFYQAFVRGQSLMRTVLENAGDILSNSLFLSNLFAFLGLESSVLDPETARSFPRPLRQGIRFRGVTFRYPHSERSALEGLDLEVPAGAITAVVGANGAGKSSLAKLLVRFYDPQRGSVELDGIDLRQFALADLRRRIACLLQLPVDYHATAGANIVLGNWRREARDGGDKDGFPAPASEGRATWDRFGEDVRGSAAQAAVRAGVDGVIQALPRGYDTLLGKHFADGTELSMGEWQRLAMARAYFRDADILILDEPTSFMDSWAEAHWFENLRRGAAGKTIIVITHRFSIARRADRIVVLDRGRVAEQGTHDQLLRKNGSYAASWGEQSGLSAREANS